MEEEVERRIEYEVERRKRSPILVDSTCDVKKNLEERENDGKSFPLSLSLSPY